MPTIDSDLQQVIEEIAEILRRPSVFYPAHQRLRLEFLTARRTLLARVLLQREKEHEEVE